MPDGAPTSSNDPDPKSTNTAEEPAEKDPLTDDSEVSASEEDVEEKSDVAGSDNDASEATEEETDPVVQLTAEVETLRAELEVAKEQVLRAHAEAENTRKRTSRELENSRKYALESFARELLPALDSFEIALQSAHASEADKSIFEGIELSVKSLTDAMEKRGITMFDPQGEVFDPDKHKAMTQIEHPDSEPGTVIEVFRKGYLIQDRLLREAEVLVSKASESKEQPSDEEAGEE